MYVRTKSINFSTSYYTAVRRQICYIIQPVDGYYFEDIKIILLVSIILIVLEAIN